MEDFILYGTIFNAALVAVGATVGFLIKSLTFKIKGMAKKIDTISSLVTKALGLAVLLMGIKGALEYKKILVLILSVSIGALIGEIIDLDKGVNFIGDKIGQKFKNQGKVAEGFVNSTLLFCVGAMVITGALEAGLGEGHGTYEAKAIIDAVTAMFLAISFGVLGIYFTCGSIIIIQGGMTLLSSVLVNFLQDAVITEMSAVGSLLMIAIGLNMIGITKIKVMNLTPAIFLPILFCLFI